MRSSYTGTGFYASREMPGLNYTYDYRPEAFGGSAVGHARAVRGRDAAQGVCVGASSLSSAPCA
jgi:hypothetical protein